MNFVFILTTAATFDNSQH